MKKPEKSESLEQDIKPGINLADLIDASNRVKRDDVIHGGIMKFNYLLKNVEAEEFGESLREVMEKQQELAALKMKRDLCTEGMRYVEQKNFSKAMECFQQLENTGHPEGKLLRGACLMMTDLKRYFEGISLMASACFEAMENHFFIALRGNLEAGCQNGLFKNPKKLKHHVNEAEMALQLNNFICAIEQEKNPALAAAILLQNLRKFME